VIVSRSLNEFLFWYWRDLGKSRAKEQPNGGGGVECGVDNFSLEMEPVAVGTHSVIGGRKLFLDWSRFPRQFEIQL
jgi:hypothetical protein